MYDSEFRRFAPKDPTNEDAEKETFLDDSGKAYNCYILINKDMKYIVKALRVVKDYIKQQEEAGKKVLLISLMAGHGMIADNEQVLLCNKITAHRFYEMLPIESLIRCIGAEHANVYSITLFACCRQKYEVKEFAKHFAKDSKEYHDFSKIGQDSKDYDAWIEEFK